jgi:hypothetical protein
LHGTVLDRTLSSTPKRLFTRRVCLQADCLLSVLTDNHEQSLACFLSSGPPVICKACAFELMVHVHALYSERYAIIPPQSTFGIASFYNAASRMERGLSINLSTSLLQRCSGPGIGIDTESDYRMFRSGFIQVTKRCSSFCSHVQAVEL